MIDEKSPTSNSEQDIKINDSTLFELLQDHFPLHPRPFRILSKQLGTSEISILNKLHDLVKAGVLRKIGALVNHQKLGSRQSTLIAGTVPNHRINEVVNVINEYKQVSHNYRRDHQFNLWFTLAERNQEALETVFNEIKERTKIDTFVSLPAIQRFKLDVRFQFAQKAEKGNNYDSFSKTKPVLKPSNQDIRILDTIYSGIPLEVAPFSKLANDLEISETKLIGRIMELRSTGIIKRFGASFNHRKIGFQGNGMSAWNIDYKLVKKVADTLVQYQEISHVYERTTIPGVWEYNLFGMIHAPNRKSCEKLVKSIANQIGIHSYVILFSTEELKKTAPPLFLDILSNNVSASN